MRQWTGPALVQIMACRLFGAKPLPEIMLVYCQLHSWKQISVKFESEFRILWFIFKKMHLKMSSARMSAILSRGIWLNMERFSNSENTSTRLLGNHSIMDIFLCERHENEHSMAFMACLYVICKFIDAFMFMKMRQCLISFSRLALHLVADILLPTYLLTDLFIYLLIYLFIYLFTYLLTYLPTCTYLLTPYRTIRILFAVCYILALP